MKKKLFLPAVFFLFCTPLFLSAAVIQVPAECSTIQSAISNAVEGDTVMIAPGTYHEHGINFQGKAITVMSEDPSDPSIVSATIVDGDSAGSVFFSGAVKDLEVFSRVLRS